MSIRFKRVLAFVIDWNITLLPFILVFSFCIVWLRQQSHIDPLFMLLPFLIVIVAMGTFVLRDVVFKGRSLGKRICGLYVYEKSTLQQAGVKQCFLRNIFFFLYVIDGVLLLATGETIGDRVAGTLVTSKQGMESYSQEMQDGFAAQDSPASKKQKRKKILVTAAIIVALLVAFAGLIQIALNAQKDTEEYKIAYSYLIESKAFQELNADESNIRFNRYSSHTYTSKNNDSVSQTVEIGFVVNAKSFTVVCHKENDVWKVCNECTLFE